METILIQTDEDIFVYFEDFLHGRKKGIIPLPVPVINTFEWDNDNSHYCIVLSLKADEADAIAKCLLWVVLEPGTSDLCKGQKLSSDDYKNAQMRYGQTSFSAMTGPECLVKMLSNIDAKKEFQALYQKKKILDCKIAEATRREVCSDDHVFYSEFNELNDIEMKIKGMYHMMYHGELLIDNIRILPGNLRYIAKDFAEKYPHAIMDDIKMAYMKIAKSAARYSRLIELGAPTVIIYNERMYLQSMVNLLFAGDRTKKIGRWHYGLMDLVQLTMSDTTILY